MQFLWIFFVHLFLIYICPFLSLLSNFCFHFLTSLTDNFCIPCVCVNFFSFLYNLFVLLCVCPLFFYLGFVWRERRGAYRSDARGNSKVVGRAAHDGEVCHPQCSADGCWGKGPNKCLTCRQYVDDEERVCLSSCSERPLLYYAGNGKCKRCHSECAHACTGPVRFSNHYNLFLWVS